MRWQRCLYTFGHIVLSVTHKHKHSSLSSSFWWHLICSQVSACLFARLFANVCVTASICLRGAPPTFIFLICPVTTYGLLDQTHPTPTPKPAICPGRHSQELWLLTYKHLHTHLSSTFQTHSCDKAWHVYRSASRSLLQMFPLFHIQRCFETAA